jgi:dimeric dUTPase (all-alpha-NTP-PPase superfamily)
MLTRIFQAQAALNKRLAVPTVRPHDAAERRYWVLNIARAMQQELAELVDCYPWKWWAHYQKENEQNARVEVVDLLHFLVSLCLVLGIKPDELVAAYDAKMAVNTARQDSGYTQKEDDCTHV